MREDEWPAFVEVGKRQYAADMVENGGMTPQAAAEKAEQDFAGLLPEGLATEGHFIYAIEDAETGSPVGRLWFAVREVWGESVAFLYDVYLEESVRGRGLGKQAMLLLEEEARARGLTRVSLNVFGGNTVARSLYRALGYAENAVWMSKALSSAPASPI